MIELKANFRYIWMRYDAICFTSNKTLDSKNRLVMGAGIAKVFKEQFKDVINLPEVFGSNLFHGKHLDGFMVVNKPYSIIPCSIVAFPTKDDWKLPSRLDIIQRSVTILKTVADIFGWKKVLLPRPGCANGKLKWEEVKPLLSILDDRFTILEEGVEECQLIDTELNQTEPQSEPKLST